VRLESLTSRQQEVLRSVLDEYVETAQPVSSRSVAARFAQSVSSATVRTVMGELTEIGLLCQPHTSAGRVPTERAFRMLVDRLLREPRPCGDARPELALDAEPPADREELLRGAADLLTRATGQLGFVVSARPERMVLGRVHFVRASSERVLAVLVSEHGVVQTRAFEESDSDQRSLDTASSLVSEMVAGLTLGEARARLAGAIERDRARSDLLWRRVLALAGEGLAPAHAEELYVGDLNLILHHPEFAEVGRLRALLTALEEKQRMLRLLDRVLRADVLSVAIGSELADPDIDACAVVSVPVGEAPPLGSFGVIGPVRMPYERVISAVQSLSERLGQYLA
jgi:heat-inducible transcriptional repressor